MATEEVEGRRRQRKRPRDGQRERQGTVKNIDESSPIIKSFLKFQQELDCKHDKHERLVKLSRDVTIQSKRIIFLLQRVAGTEKRDEIFTEAEDKFNGVKSLLKSIASELEDEDPYLFLRAYSPGVQEFIEAQTFYHYLKKSSLISFEEISHGMVFTDEDANLVLKVSPFDYILGVADLTGELMRLCVNSAANGDRKTPFQVCKFLRSIYDSFVSFGNCSRDVASKLRVLRSSLHKVESACYTLQVRGSEIPKHMLADVLGSATDLKRLDIDEF